MVSGSSASPLSNSAFVAARNAERWDAGQPVRTGWTVADVIDSFIPRDVPFELWVQVAALVRDAATKTRPKSPYRAEILMSTISGLVHWCHREGMPVSTEVVFHPDTIDRYVFIGIHDLTEGTKANYRTILRQVGRAVLGPPLYREAVSFPNRRPKAPYTAPEMAAIVGWLRGLRTPRMQENALILVATAAGAGLASQDITRLVGTDVEDLGEEGVLVHVPGDRARTVPVLRRWERHVANRAAAVGERPLFLPARTAITRRDISSFIAKLPTSDAPKLSVTRLRHTWIVHHLAIGTPMPSLERAAGAGADSFARLVVHVPEAAEDTFRRHLRGAPSE